MKPVKGNVLVRCFEGDNMSEGGIIVPDSVKTESNKVEIVEVGEGTKAKPMQFKKGDIGFRVKGWGQEVLIDGVRHYLMDQSAVIARQ